MQDINSTAKIKLKPTIDDIHILSTIIVYADVWDACVPITYFNIDTTQNQTEIDLTPALILYICSNLVL